jgi:ATP-dependent RNA helicase DBP3
VVAPTRELAMQSHQVCLDVGGLKSVCIYGGVPKQQQKADLRAGTESFDKFGFCLVIYWSLIS